MVPQTHLETADNIRYFNGGFETRYGTSVSEVIPAGVSRFFPYLIEGQADRVLYLTYDIPSNTGKIYDSLFPTSPIHTVVGMKDFSMIVLNDRAYLSPHDGSSGMPGQFIHVYQGGGIVARLAGGNAPSGFTLISSSDASGKIEAGFRVLAVAFETDSGHITRPGPTGYHTNTFTEGCQILLTSIYGGPAGTVARHILSSQAIITDFDGNIEDIELFFVEAEFGGVLNDNLTAETRLDFYDSQLVRSADYLRDNMETIPAVLGFTTFAGSLVGWAPNTEPASVYLSRSGEPESISLLEGGIEVDKSSGGGVKNCVEYRGAALMIHKSNKLYTTSNNGEEPVYWKVDKVDAAIGTSVFGVAAILDEEGNTVDRYIIAARQGLIAYEGNFNNVLSASIDDVWSRITRTAWSKVQVVLDPHNEFIVVLVPLDGAASPNCILYCDYANGLTPDGVRWAKWTFPYAINSVGIDVDLTGRPQLKIGSPTANIYYLDDTAQGDNLVAIPSPTIRTAYVGDVEGAVNYYGGVRLRAVGTGAVDLRFNGLDETLTINPPGFFLSLSPGRLQQRDFNLSSQLGRLKVSTASYGDRFKITRISIYYKPEYFEEPA